MTEQYLSDLRKAQNIAKTAMGMIGEFIKPGVTDAEIHDFAGRVMKDLGSGEWWIHGDPALVLVGDRTSYSAAFDPAAPVLTYTVADTDVVSVDVAPTFNGAWGDFARTFFVRDGKACLEPKSGEDIAAIELEHKLHEMMRGFVSDKTTFNELYEKTRGILEREGYENCDYHDNYGHTIELHSSERVTIAAGVGEVISEHARPFTFEPHIKKKGDSIGYKLEDMYMFEGGRLVKI